MEKVAEIPKYDVATNIGTDSYKTYSAAYIDYDPDQNANDNTPKTPISEVSLSQASTSSYEASATFDEGDGDSNDDTPSVPNYAEATTVLYHPSQKPAVPQPKLVIDQEKKPPAPQAYFPAMDWNSRFQQLLEKVTALDTSKEYSSESSRLWREIADLGQDFIHCAKSYGKIIISEVALPEELKTIKPLKSIGGILGGEKYKVANMLFKFALDVANIFGGDDECASKVAGLDLRGLEHLLSCGPKGLFFPLTAVIDYRGFRLVAVSLLPIEGQQTLVYGSANGTATGLRCDEAAGAELCAVAKKLNLKAHPVGGKVIYTPTDLVHRSASDNRMYALDFSRTFPPERLSVADQKQLSDSQTNTDQQLSQSQPLKIHSSSASSGGAYLHKMGNTSSTDNAAMFRSDGQLQRPNEDRLFLCRQLRPEYVRQYRIPLNPDAFSGFGSHDEGFKESCREVSAAVMELYKRTIPSFAAELQRIWFDQSRKRNLSDDRYGKSLVKNQFGGGAEPVSLYDTPDETLQSLNLVTAVHDAGINLRHLGRVRAALPSTEIPLRTLVLIEMLARTIKVELHRRQRLAVRKDKVGLPTVSRVAIIEYLNSLFGNDYANDKQKTHWRPLREELKLKFPNGLFMEEQSGDVNLRQFLIDFKDVNVARSIAPDHSDTTESGASHVAESNSPHGLALLFERVSQLCALRWRDNLLSRIARPTQLRLSKPLSALDLVSAEERVKTLSLFSFCEGASLLDDALKYHTSDYALFTQIARDAVTHLRESLSYFGSSARTRRVLARALTLMNQPLEAEPHLLRALRLQPNNTLNHLTYAQFLLSQTRLDEVLKELCAALKCEPLARQCSQQLMEFAVHQYHSADVLTPAFAPYTSRPDAAVVKHLTSCVEMVKRQLSMKESTKGANADTLSQFHISITLPIAVPATRVWALIADFAKWHIWHSGIYSTISCREGNSVGSIRTLRLSTGCVMNERVISCSDEKRQLSYTFVGHTMAMVWPVRKMEETVSVTEEKDNSCAVVWQVSGESDLSADAISEILSGFIYEGLYSLQKITAEKPPPAEVTTKNEIWRVFAGLEPMLQRKGVPAVMEMLRSSSFKEVKQLCVQLLFSWVEDSTRRNQMIALKTGPFIAEDINTPALRHCEPIVRTSICLLRKLTREDAAVPQLLPLAFLPDLLLSLLQPTDVTYSIRLAQNTLIVISHLAQHSAPFAEQLEKSGALSAIHETLKRHRDSREVVDCSIFAMTALCKSLASARSFVQSSGFAEAVVNVLWSVPQQDTETLTDGADFVIAIASRDDECCKCLVKLDAISVLVKWIDSEKEAIVRKMVSAVEAITLKGFGVEELKSHANEVREALAEAEDKANCPLLKLLDAN